MRRNEVPNLNRNRPLYFKIGLIISLSLVIMVFNLSFDENEEVVQFSFKLPAENTIPLERFTVKTENSSETRKIVTVKSVDPTDEPVFSDEPVADDNLVEGAPEDLSSDNPVLVTPSKEPVAPPLPPEPPSNVPDFWRSVEEMPRFGDCLEGNEEEKIRCTENNLLEFIYKNLRYPEMARASRIEGTVVGEFKVDKKGKVVEVAIIRGIGGGCDEEVIKVLKGMPAWVPGKMQGKAVKVLYRIPIRFRLE